MSIGNNHKELIGYLNYAQDENDILQWSLIGSGAAILISLVVVVLVCIYRRRRAARQLPDNGSMHLSDYMNLSMKLDYTGRVHGVGAQGTRAVLREENTATGLRDAMSLRPRNVDEAGPVRWHTSRPGDSNYLMDIGQHGAAQTAGDFDTFNTGYLRPGAEAIPERDPPIPGVYIVPT